jgi:D-beta-D-heptose 7-phosphate kinase/D-beta-D-heptose 1-phosphate adenosyltransferase
MAASLAEKARRQGKKVVFTNGCFDLLHVGHVTYLAEAAALGDVLIVGVNSDASVRRLKGAERPVIGERDRAALLAALAAVACVVVFDEETPHALLAAIRPDVLVKGGTYTPEQVVGHELVTAYGGEVRVTGVVDGISTTHILETIATPLRKAG